MKKVFSISDDLNITAYASAAQARKDSEPGSVYFTTEAELKQRTKDWPGSRLVDLRNSIPGLERVGKNAFKTKAVAFAAIWRAVQKLAVDDAVVEFPGKTEPVEQPKTEPAEQPKTEDRRQKKERKPRPVSTDKVYPYDDEDREHLRLTGANPFRENTRSAEIWALCARPDGATIEEICRMTGWKRHSVRGWFWHLVRRAA